MKRVSGWMASAVACLLAAPAMAGEDVDAKLAEMQELVQGLKQKVEAQDEQIEHQGKLLEDAQRVVRADEQGTLSGLAAFIDSLEVDGGVAASYNYNLNDVSGKTTGAFADLNSGQSGLFEPFHRDDNTFQVDMAWFGLGKPATEESRGGFRFDIFYGATASNYGTGNTLSREDIDNDSTSDLVVDQAYVEYLAPIADANLKLGKFATPVGAEVVKQWANFNITRGIVYAALQPVNHLGIMGTIPIGDMASIGAGVVNSGGSLISAPDDSKEKSYIGTLYLGDSRANIRTSFIYGFEPTFTGAEVHTGDQAGLADVTAWFNPTDNISLWANYDYLFVEDTGFYSHGVALAGRVGFLEDFGWAVRGEYLFEHDSPNNGLVPFTSGHNAHVWTLTSTWDYALTDHLKAKLEYRYDLVNDAGQEFAEGEDVAQENDQSVVLIGAEYVF